MNEEVENVEQKANAYYYLGSKDRHLVRLFHWIKSLQEFSDEVRESDQDGELEKTINDLISRLTHEVGVRTLMLFP